MLIGICSDTHGQVATMRRALVIFDRLGVERIIHCGDVGGEEVFDQLVGREVRFVWGNTDVVTAGLLAYLQTVGLPAPQGVPLVLEWAGRRIAVFHGHERGFSAAPQTMNVDYILHGHTHMRWDERIGSVRIINPGALHRARTKTVATLNLATDELTSHDVPPA
jgi:hypothetical protein